MARRRARKDEMAALANSLTTEQVIALYQFIQPLSEAEQAHYDAMSDDALLAELDA